MSYFYETIFLKDNSSLELKLDDTKKNDSSNKKRIYNLEKGIAGENQVVYHLKKSSIGMYVIRDLNMVCDDLKAQVDFVVVTSHHCYFIECKNYSDERINVNEDGSFSRSNKKGNKWEKKGIKSPISQVEDQLTVFKNLCLKETDKTKELLNGIRFKDYFKTIVVFTNPEGILNKNKAPSDLKYKVLKVDGLLRQIEYDEKHYNGNKLTKEQMKILADFILEKNVEISLDNLPSDDFETIDDNTNQIDSDYSTNNIEENNKKTKIIKIFFAIVLIALWILIIFNYNKIIEFSNKKESEANRVSLTANQKKTINAFKTAYKNSKENGFDLINTGFCKEMSEFFGITSFSCDRFPLEVNVISKTKMTIYKNYWCYTLEISDDGNKLVNAKGVTKGYAENTDCKGEPIGYFDWEENNEYYQKIGGFNKIKEMATYAYVNNTFVDNYYDYSHIEERGGITSNSSLYKMNVDMFFSALTGRGYDVKASSTNKEETNKMVESYYYIMK